MKKSDTEQEQPGLEENKVSNTAQHCQSSNNKSQITIPYLPLLSLQIALMSLAPSFFVIYLFLVFLLCQFL